MRRLTCPLGKCLKRGCRGCVEKMISGYKDIPGCAMAGYSVSERRVLRLRFLRPSVISIHIRQHAAENAARQQKQARARHIYVMMRNEFLSERLQTVLDMWCDGATFKQIGRRFGVTGFAARLWFDKAVRRMRDCSRRHPWIIEEAEACTC